MTFCSGTIYHNTEKSEDRVEPDRFRKRFGTIAVEKEDITFAQLQEVLDTMNQ